MSQPLPPRSRFQRTKDFIDPRHRSGGYIGPHVVLIAVLLALAYATGFGSGWLAGTHYNATHFRQHYHFPGLKTPPPGTSAPIRDVHRAGLPAATSVDLAVYPAVGNQGSLGACAAWASAWAASYELRKAGVGWIRLSPIWMYSRFADLYSGGRDGGSWPDQDLETLGSSGIPQWKQLPAPPYQIDDPLPTTNVSGTAMVYRRHAYQIHVISGFAQGAGQGAVDGIRAAIAAGHPVMIALPVYPEYDNATQQPLIVSPQPGEVSRGGHENVILAYDDTRVFPDGTVGGVEIQNQWTKQWGATGRAWLSYDFVRRYSFGLEYLTLGAQAPRSGPKPAFRANPKAHLYKPPYDPGMRPTVGAGTTAWYVHGVHLYNRSSGADISGIINLLGDQYHVWPVALAATIGTESAFDPNAERWAGGLDNSCGLGQQIITNVYPIIGNYNARAACNWEEVPGNSLALTAKILHEDDVYHGGRVPWIFQYVFYNAGAGVSDAFALNPCCTAAQNLYGNFAPWYRYSLAVFAGGSAPTPKPTPKPRIVCGKRLSLTHNRKAGFWFARFQWCQKWTWPKYHYRQKTVVTWKKR